MIRVPKAEKSSTLSSHQLSRMALWLKKAIYWAALKAPINELLGNKASSGSLFQSHKTYCNHSWYYRPKSFGIPQYPTLSILQSLLKGSERAQITGEVLCMLLGPALVWQFQWNLLLASGQPGACLLALFSHWPGLVATLNGNLCHPQRFTVQAPSPFLS